LGGIFSEDGYFLFECHINLFELGKVFYCEVFDTGPASLNRGGLQLSFIRRGSLSLAGPAFLDNILLGGFVGLGFARD
jgi:hypothetical protein